MDTPLTDWKGNEIKPGMEVCLIEVVDRQLYRAGYIIPVIPGVAHIEHMEDARPDQPCWNPGKYYLVNEDMTIEEFYNDCTVRQHLSIALLWSNAETHILAIKGISDQKP